MTPLSAQGITSRFVGVSMRWFKSLLFLSFPLSTFAEGGLPVISLSQLQPGASYTWSYFANSEQGAPYSTERYEVLEQKNSFVTILMSTRLDGQNENVFRPTHKFTVDFRKCLEAHRDSRQKHNFLIDLYPVQADGAFAKQPVLTPATAFEEKFNCHPQLRKGWPDSYETIFSEEITLFGGQRLFQQRRTPGDQLVGFYFLEHEQLKGVLFRKDFNPGKPNHFAMRLVEWRAASGAIAPGVNIRPAN